MKEVQKQRERTLRHHRSVYDPRSLDNEFHRGQPNHNLNIDTSCIHGRTSRTITRAISRDEGGNQERQDDAEEDTFVMVSLQLASTSALGPEPPSQIPLHSSLTNTTRHARMSISSNPASSTAPETAPVFAFMNLHRILPAHQVFPFSAT